MRTKKPTLAGLKRQLVESEANTDKWHNLVSALRGDLANSERAVEEAQREFKSSDKRVGWYEREREQTQAWYEQSLRLLAPHLVPNPHNHSIDLAGNDPMERFLIEVRERLSRYYSEYGETLHRDLERGRPY
jgi:hypothetical protein